MITLTSRSLQFECNPDQALWSLLGPTCRIAPSRMGVQFRSEKGKSESFYTRWVKAETSSPQGISSPHGQVQYVRVATGPDPESGLVGLFDFALSEDRPFLLWRMKIRNQGEQAVYIDRIDLLTEASAANRSAGAEVFLPHGRDRISFFSNGWQSWSYSATYLNHQRMRHSRLGPLQNPMVVNTGTAKSNQAGYYTSEFFGVLNDLDGRGGLIAGFLSQAQHFGSIEACTDGRVSLRVTAQGDGARLDPGQQIKTDWAVLWFIDIDDPDPLGPYLDAVNIENHVGKMIDVPTGWCSWYHFYEQVTASDVENNLQSIKALDGALPIQIVQIDDGFEKQVGDWLEFKPTFPHGVAPLADKIRKAGKTPGLWLAPFIVHPEAEIVRQHPDWLLRDFKGHPVNAGYGWRSFARALDLTVPEALEYGCQVVDKAVHEWGFPYLKLDFLYTGGLAGKHHDPTKTRAQILRHALSTIRKAAGPQTTLVGCGVPLGSAVGLFETMRISCDVSGEWGPVLLNMRYPVRSEPCMPSVRNALQDIIVRAPLHRRWWINDADCLVARPDTRLTRAEVQNLATAIALTGGSMLISDDLPDRWVDWLGIPQKLLPAIGKRARVLDLFDAQTPSRLRVDLQSPSGDYSLLAVFNWSEVRKSMRLDLKEFGFDCTGGCFARSFWEEKTYWFDWGMIDLDPIPPHGVALLALRNDVEGKPQYLGSNLHISQGMEVTEWREEKNQVRITLNLGRYAKGEIEVKLPRLPNRVTLNGAPLPWKPTGDGKYAFPVEFARAAKLCIEMDE